MNKQVRNWLCEITALSIYKFFFEFVFLQRYMSYFSYAYNNYSYNFIPSKWGLSIVLFGIFCFALLFTRENDNPMYLYVIRFVYTICFIPMLSVYAFFDGINDIDIIYPTVFLAIFLLMLGRYARQGEVEKKQIIQMPRILYINTVLLAACGIIAVAIWVWSGRPVFFSLSYTLEQRLQLRANAMPTIIAYLFMFLGSTVFPYLFAKYIDERKYLYSIASFVCGILLFFINGMKTWLFLYLFYFGIAAILIAGRKKVFRTYLLIDIMMIMLLIVSVFALDRFKIIDLVSQIARVTVVPNDIGFTFVDFFKKSENPFLFLRESILRGLFNTPYANGSDFFVTNGANASLSSARANNGLWGDAFRNFGVIGIIVYPFLIAKMFNIVEINSRHMKPSLRLFALFMILWSSINTSFFTWLLTGGVFVIIILEKIDRSNYEYINSITEESAPQTKRRRIRFVFGRAK